MMPEYSTIVAYVHSLNAHGDIQGILFGDNGYPCRQYLMAVIDPQTRPQRRYNVHKYVHETLASGKGYFNVFRRLFKQNCKRP
jgi:hypothetical protein